MYADVGTGTHGSRPFRAKANASPSSALRRSVLLVEHDKETREMVREFLEGMGHSTALARSGVQAEQLFKATSPDIVVIDCALPDGSSLPLISRFKQLDPFVRLIALSGYGSLDDAVEAMKAGAEQFLTKPVDRSALSCGVDRALDDQRNHRHQLASEIDSGYSPNLFVGAGSAIREVANAAHFVANGSGPVLIEGDLGTGKRWLAQWLHRHSPRANEPFIDVPCTDQPRLESQLFGFAGNAVNDSVPSATGLIVFAQHGTVLLRDVDRMDVRLQSRLAGALEKSDSSRSSPLRTRNLDFRLITTARESIAHLVKEKRFRSDLYAHLTGNRLVMPSLRDRIEDIPHLAAEILNNLTSESGTRGLELTQGALAALQDCPWPGNLLQLRNVLEHAMLATEGNVLTEVHLNLELQSTDQPCSQTPSHTLKELQRQYIEQVFRAEGGRVDATAKKLGIPRSSLYHKLKQYRIERFGSRPIRHLGSSCWIHTQG